MIGSIFLAMRPKTLPAAIVPVWLGVVLTILLEGKWDFFLALSTLMGAIWIQIATNFFNDAIDAQRGADTEQRLGPKRATASGWLSSRAVYLLAISSLLIASLFGVHLIYERGWVMLLIGLPALYLCYGYTGGPFALAYCGLGELFVLLCFGFLAVMGTVFVQTGTWYFQAALLGLQVGCLSAVLISINNLRDVDEDRGNGKNTLAVKWGVQAVRWIILLEVMVAYSGGVIWSLLGYPQLAYYTLGAFIVSLMIVVGVWKHPPGKIYNRYLALGGVALMGFGGLFHLAAL